MQIWQELVKFSLIGTERQTSPFNAEGDLQRYLEQLYPNNIVPADAGREQAFLSSAALVTQYRLAGQRPLVFDGVLPEPDTHEALPELSSLAVNQLEQLLNNNELKAVLPEWFEWASQTKRRVPYRLIPALLDIAAGNRKLRPAITVLIDQRGIWLAKQHPEWHKLLVQTHDELIESVWQEGNAAERELYLKQLREQNPEKAREQLQVVWKQEPAATRQSFLAVLQEQLSNADEAFLTACLSDKSKVVRQQAVTLLSQLDNSALSQRQKQRLNQWLRLEKGLLKKPKLLVELPEHYDSAWQQDGIEEKPPHGKGQKAWWLEQALSNIPLNYWSDTWQMSPEEILSMVHKHDWKTSLETAWRLSLACFHQGDWAEAFLLRSDINDSQLWQMFDDAHAERLAEKLISNTDVHKLNKVLPILNYLQHHWTAHFSVQVMQALTRYTAQKLTQSDAYSCYYLADIGRYLHPSCCDEMTALVKLLEEKESLISRTFNKILYVLTFRRDMAVALSQQ